MDQEEEEIQEVKTRKRQNGILKRHPDHEENTDSEDIDQQQNQEEESKDTIQQQEQQNNKGLKGFIIVEKLNRASQVYIKDNQQEDYGICIVPVKDKLDDQGNQIFKQCGHSFKRKRGNTAALKEHLKQKHEEYYKKLYIIIPEELKKQKEQEKAKNGTLVDYFQNNNNKQLNEKQLDNLISLMIAKSKLPLSFVESVEFQILCSFIKKDYKVPHRKKVRTNIIKLYETGLEQIINGYKNMNKENILKSILCIQHDHWKHPYHNEHYNVYNWSYMNNEFDQIYQLIGAFIVEDETGETIAENTTKIIKKMGIDQYQFLKQKPQIFLCTDAAANMHKQIEYIKENFEILAHFRCMNHQLHLNITDLNKKCPKYQELYQKKQKICARFKNSNDGDKLKEFFEVLEAEKPIEDRQEYLEMKLDCQTRWFAQEEQDKALIRNEKAIKKFYEEVENKNQILIDNELTRNDWSNIKFVKDLFYKIYRFKDQLQQNKNSMICYALVTYKHIQLNILKVNDAEKNDSFKKNVKLTLQNSFKSRYETYYQEYEDMLIGFAYLNPVQSNLLEKYNLDKKIGIQYLQNFLLPYYYPQYEIVQKQQQSQNQKIKKTLTSKSHNNYQGSFEADFLKMNIESNDINQEETEYLNIQQEVQKKFIREQEIYELERMEFLKQYQQTQLEYLENGLEYQQEGTLKQFYTKVKDQIPIHAFIFQLVGGISISTSETERANSQLGDLITAKRNNLKEDITEAYIFLKLNTLNQTIDESQILQIADRNIYKLKEQQSGKIKK